MKNGLFVTGTDTGVGKTLVTGLLARYFIEKGCGTITQKWVQTGSEGGSEDILAHFRIMGSPVDKFSVHMPDMAPYIFKLPAAPHLAALEEGSKIEPAVIQAAFRRLSGHFEFVIAEGAGGALVPVNEKMTMLDIAKQLDLPVIIVAENKLGAINQCLLTVEAAQKRALEITGIIFNRMNNSYDERIMRDNPYIISKFTGAEFLGEIHNSSHMDQIFLQFEQIGEKIMRKLGINT